MVRIDTDEGGFLNSFDKYDETCVNLKGLLSAPLALEPSPEENKAELDWSNGLTRILDEYQEQPNLLDPYLEDLINPIVIALRNHVKEYTSGNMKTYSSTRVNRLAWAMYSFVKVRGHKTLVRLFPHEVSDLPIVIDYLNSVGPVKRADAWVLRYIMLLWLSLVCMLPFDLAQFDDGSSTTTARKIERLGISELSKAGLERDGSALLLSRLYMRKDTSYLLASFLKSTGEELHGSPSLFMIMGALRVLADVAKTSPMDLLQPHIVRIRDFIDEASQVSFLAENTSIRKLRTKCISRVAARLLPAGTKKSWTIGKLLDPNMRKVVQVDDCDKDEYEVPDAVEAAIGDLFELLQDKDTLVRWSSAKGIATISERLPLTFVDQIIDNILDYFAAHAPDVELSELSAMAEHPWHGAALACAELARRNLIPDTQLPNVVMWMSKAIFFDVQKGTFSIGSNVRDAAAYVFWSLARTRSKKSLAPYAIELAQNLVTVALFDREIHIRRAASAAFQENVGRMGLFPHGIAIIGVIDFFSVSIRRNAFLVAAPNVFDYKEYQESLLEHLLSATLRHWDEAMRRLGAQSLRRICKKDLELYMPRVLDTLSSLLLSVDTTDIHGGLLALSELAGAISETKKSGNMEQYRRKIFTLVESVPSSTIVAPRNHLIMEAACHVISNAISTAESDVLQKSTTEPYWRTIVLQGLRHRRSEVQEAAAAAMHSLKLQRGPAIMQQSLARVLGSLDYLSHKNGFNATLRCLLDAVDPKVPTYFKDVEARRNAYISLAAIVVNLSPKLDAFIDPDILNTLWHAFFAGLEDYTVNERGDVGSWIRISCVRGISTMLQVLIREAQDENDHPAPSWATKYSSFAEYLPVNVYHKMIGSILKQGVERLDNVRQCVGEVLPSILRLEHPSFEGGQDWTVRGKPIFMDLFESEKPVGWNDASWLFPKAVRFLDILTYRNCVLRGLLLSIGSKTSSTQQIASSSILAYVRSLQSTRRTTSSENSNDLYTFLLDLLAVALENPKSNTSVIPILHTFSVLLEREALSPLFGNDEGQSIQLVQNFLDLATKNIERLKSIQRIEESMKIIVDLVCVPSKVIKKQAAVSLGRFLLHPFPMVVRKLAERTLSSPDEQQIRNDTAEALYVSLQAKDVEYESEAEDILLETEWLTEDLECLDEPVKRLLACLD